MFTKLYTSTQSLREPSISLRNLKPSGKAALMDYLETNLSCLEMSY